MCIINNCSLCFLQEPAKEDLTVSEKFQLVLDVAQKAQVQLSTSLQISAKGLNTLGVFIHYKVVTVNKLASTNDVWNL